MYRAIIVDDSYEVGEYIKQIFLDTGKFIIEDVLNNGKDLMSIIKNIMPDIVFLDISMPNDNGINIAGMISQLNNPPTVVFVTSYDYYALDAFRVNAFDYLIKPLKMEEVNRLINKLDSKLGIKNRQTNNKMLKIKSLGGVEFKYGDNGVSLKFPTSKCQELFLYLVFYNINMHSKWHLIDILWPDKDEAKGESNLRTTIYRINQTFSDNGIELKVKSDGGFYGIDIENITVDAFELEKINNPKCLVSLDKEKVVEFIREIYKGNLFEGYDYSWSLGLKSYYESFFINRILRYVDNLKENQSDKYLKLEIIDYLLEISPYNENLLMIKIRILYELGGSNQIETFFESVEKRYIKEIGSKPSVEVYNLIKDLRR